MITGNVIVVCFLAYVFRLTLARYALGACVTIARVGHALKAYVERREGEGGEEGEAEGEAEEA
jgi:hypothetical protein